MTKNEATQGRQKLLERAMELFSEYRSAYLMEWQRLEDCERIYRGDHWYGVPLRDENEPRPVTPVIQSTIENISAELMDRMPEAVIAPESPEDARVAKVLEAIIRQNHDAASYAKEYRGLVHDLLVGGYAVQEVGYDTEANGGLGGAFIRHVDNRSILFDPLCTDFQEGRAVIKFSIRSRDWLQSRFPQEAAFLSPGCYVGTEAVRDEVLHADRRDTLLLLEYWWREFDREENLYRVHMALIAGNRVLMDSREAKPEGYYEHGAYPFVLTALYPRKGTSLGLGVVDMFRTQQQYADKLDQIVLKNALMASRNKLLVTEASGFDTDDLKDWSKEIHKGESLNGVTWFSTPPLPGYIINYIDAIRENIKQESGANDFSRGMTTGGITAASAIESLQEMSNKRSRTMSRQLHEAFRDAVRMEIAVEREFNFFSREVMVELDGEQERCTFESAMLSKPVPGDVRVPIEFLISVRARQETRYAANTQNELVFKMLSAGVITARQAVELMVFDGKDKILKEIREEPMAVISERMQRSKQEAEHA